MNYNYRILENKNIKYIEESRPNTTVAQDHRWNAYDLIHKSVDQMSKEFFWSLKPYKLNLFKEQKYG
jgi:hypothetical protein